MTAPAFSIGGILVTTYPEIQPWATDFLRSDWVREHLTKYWEGLPPVGVYIFPRSWLTEETWREWYSCPEDNINRKLPPPYGVHGRGPGAGDPPQYCTAGIR